ncbi:glycosyltransferase family 8 protein [Methylobacterium nigriterrae]|uniref:glycosyltransferase family 8 protein n=1 Tax=Methylobacterium nigriterrae TaxID=3127512 RepID=UPI00301348EF
MPQSPETPIRVLYCLDNNYLRQLGISLASMLRSNPASRFEVHIAMLARDRVLSNRVMDAVTAAFGNVRIAYHDLDETLFDAFPVTQSISKSTYIRIILGRFVPRDCERILYLDADTIVRADVRPLWRTPLDGAVLAAVRDHFSLDAEAISFAPDEPYFNAGVLLIDMNRWRALDIEGRVLAYLGEHANRLPWMDQDALNAVLRGHVRYVGLEWNFQPRCADVPAEFLGLDEATYARLRAHPSLVHYTTSFKPWNAAHRVHYSGLFYEAARLLPSSPDLVPQPPGAGRFRDRLMGLKTTLRWHFPRAFRRIRQILKPSEAALMYRA